MANIWGNRLSPDVRSTGCTRPERRANAGWAQLSQTLRRGLHVWLTATPSSEPPVCVRVEAVVGIFRVTVGCLGVGTNTHTSTHHGTSDNRWVNEALSYFG
jgi:hypothetical protein